MEIFPRLSLSLGHHSRGITLMYGAQATTRQAGPSLFRHRIHLASKASSVFSNESTDNFGDTHLSVGVYSILSAQSNDKPVLPSQGSPIQAPGATTVSHFENLELKHPRRPQ